MEFVSTGKKEESFWRYLPEFFALPRLIRNLARSRELIAMMAWRDFSSRYRGSLGGLAWSVVQPLVMMVIYTIVFSLFLKVRFSTDASPITFSVYLLCGLLPWNAFSEGVTFSKDVIRTNIHFVKRVVFPLEILPLNIVLTASLQQIIGFMLLIPLSWIVSGSIFWSLLLVPLIFFLQILFSVGINWIVASLSVYLPDIRQIIPSLLMFWMFLTPVFYPEDVVPPQAMILFQINPLARLVRLYRAAFMTGQLPAAEECIGTAGFCIGAFLLGYFWFMHTKKGFADVL